MNTTGKRWALCLLFLTMATLWWAWFYEKPIHAQETGSLETECVALASASSFMIPSALTAEEYCKVMVALLGNEIEKAAKLQATILAVNDHDVRLAAAEVTITQLRAEVAALQTQTSLQPQIDAINVKLANMAAALQ